MIVEISVAFIHADIKPSHGLKGCRRLFVKPKGKNRLIMMQTHQKILMYECLMRLKSFSKTLAIDYPID